MNEWIHAGQFHDNHKMPINRKYNSNTRAWCRQGFFQLKCNDIVIFKIFFKFWITKKEKSKTHVWFYPSLGYM